MKPSPPGSPRPLTGLRERLPPGFRPKRVLFFGKNMARSRCTGGLVDALERHGLEVRWLNLATMRRWVGMNHAVRKARRIFTEFAPDMVFVFCRDLPQVLLEEFGQKVPTVLWVEEPLDDLDATHAEYMRRADLVCLSNPAKRSWLAERGVRNMMFLMSGFSPRFHYPVRGRQRRDVVFIGGPGRNGQRASFLAEISEHCSTEVFGAGWEPYRRKYSSLRIGWPVKVAGFRRLCATSRIVLGLNQVNEDPHYFSNRTFLTLACRAFHLTRYVPGLEDVFRDGQHLVWYRDAEECIDKIRHYLGNETERLRIASAGQEFALAHHQYRHRISKILTALGEGQSLGDQSQSLVSPRGVPSVPATRLASQ